MPCCAFAALVFAQLVWAVRKVGGRLLGMPADEPGRNTSVEWRLGDTAPASDAPASRTRRSLRLVALAAAVEILLVVGAIYGVVGHFRGAHHHHQDVTAGASEEVIR
jgi:hypothetical protein